MQLPSNKTALALIFLCSLIFAGGYFRYHRDAPATMFAGLAGYMTEKEQHPHVKVEAIPPLQKVIKVEVQKEYEKLKPMPIKKHLIIPASGVEVPSQATLQVGVSKLKPLQRPATIGSSLQHEIAPQNSRMLKKFEAETGITEEAIQEALNR